MREVNSSSGFSMKENSLEKKNKIVTTGRKSAPRRSGTQFCGVRKAILTQIHCNNLGFHGHRCSWGGSKGLTPLLCLFLFFWSCVLCQIVFVWARILICKQPKKRRNVLEECQVALRISRKPGRQDWERRQEQKIWQQEPLGRPDQRVGLNGTTSLVLMLLNAATWIDFWPVP